MKFINRLSALIAVGLFGAGLAKGSFALTLVGIFLGLAAAWNMSK